MGSDALAGSGVTHLILYLIKDKALVPHDEPLRAVRNSRIWLFLMLELIGFGATMVRREHLPYMAICALHSAQHCCGGWTSWLIPIRLNPSRRPFLLLLL
jgi:hypothetical protein